VERNPGVRMVEMLKDGARVDLGDETPELAAAMLRKMIADGLPVSDFHREVRRLEDAFVDILQKLEAQRDTPPPLPVPPSTPPAALPI
jgi:ABC-2 type transport system ATP-binding protein